MKKVTPETTRTKSLITDHEQLEHLYTFSDFPVFMGCTEAPHEDDLCADMKWDICTTTGLIQLKELLPLDVLYMDQHNDGTGKIWHDHYEAFAKFLHKFSPRNVLEIGGAHDKIASNYFTLAKDTAWTIVEPNPDYITNPNIKVVRGWFDERFVSEERFDTVIHSHVFEHTYDPVAFIKHIATFMKAGDRHIFTFPNLKPMLEMKWTNCLNFEHTAFLTEEITDQLLTSAGFTIIEKEYYGSPHSIFYATEKTSDPTEPAIDNHYEEYRGLFLDFVSFHINMVRELNEKIAATKGPVYLFGAHIFSQYLIAFGLKTESIVSILDNSPIKIGKRLYGTNLQVQSPEILNDVEQPTVILKVAGYRNEIAEQLTKINPSVIIL